MLPMDWIEQWLAFSLFAGVVAGVALLVNQTLGRRWSPTIGYWLWILILLRFLFFVMPASPSSALNWLPINACPTSESKEVATQSNNESFVVQYSAVPFIDHQLNPILVEKERKLFRDGYPVLGLVWLLGVLAFLTKLCLYMRDARLLIRAGTKPDRELQEVFNDMVEQVGGCRNVRLLLTDKVAVPSSSGTIWPTVFLPRWCQQKLDRDQIKIVLGHELTHVKNFDNLFQVVFYLIKAVHWFNPMVWLANKQWRRHCELYCDQAVVRNFERFGIDIRILYGKTILELACSEHQAFGTQPALLWDTFVGTEKELVRQRIEMMFEKKLFTRLQAVVAAGFFGLLLAVGFTSAQTDSTGSHGEVSAPGDTQPTQGGVYFLQPLPSVSLPKPIAENPIAENRIAENRIAEKAEQEKSQIVFEMRTLKFDLNSLKEESISRFRDETDDDMMEFCNSIFGAQVALCPIADSVASEEFVQRLAKTTGCKCNGIPKLIALEERLVEMFEGVEVPNVVQPQDANEGLSKVEFRHIGTRIGVSAHQVDDEGLVVRLKGEHSKVNMEIEKKFGGLSGFRVRTIQTGRHLRFGQSMMCSLKLEPEEFDLDNDGLEQPVFVALVTPRMLPLDGEEIR